MTTQATTQPDSKPNRLQAIGAAFEKARPRIRDFFVHALGQVRILEKAYPGIMHFLIFWGVTIQVLGTIINILNMLLFFPWVITFPRGTAYLVYELIMDIAGIAILAGVTMAFFRRIVLRPKSLETRWDDYFALSLLALIPLLGFTMEGTRLLATNPPWAAWSPIGNLVAHIIAGLGMTSQGATQLHDILFWVHQGVALTLVASIPFTKMRHLVYAPLNVIFRPLRKTGALGKIENIDQAENLGVGKISEFTSQQLLSFDACVNCGRCEEACPAFAAGTPLSPKKLILNLRYVMYQDLLGGNGKMPLLVDERIKDEVLWSCTTCGACVRLCPILIEHVNTIVDMRRHLVIEGRMDGMLQDALANLGRYGNSFGQSDRMRAKWTQPILPTIKDARKEAVEYCWFVGDYASYSASLIEITQKTSNVFHKIGLDYGILYEGERNAGNDVRRVGEEGLFEMLTEKNMAVLSKSMFQTIITTDPHSYNTLKNEYSGNGNHPILHYSELLDQMITSGKLKFSKKLGYKVTYHDPCYLGRYNGVFDAPRRVIAATGGELIEMPRNRARSFCCGAGGGRIWMEEGSIKERPSESRIHEAVKLDGVQVFVVACPKDITMYRDAVKTTGKEDQIIVKDLIELVEEAL